MREEPEGLVVAVDSVPGSLGTSAHHQGKCSEAGQGERHLGERGLVSIMNASSFEGGKKRDLGGFTHLLLSPR
jgi:hypothetical protein